MGSEFTISVTQVTLMNDTNELTLTVDLSSVWSTILLHSYLFVNTQVSIPLVTTAGSEMLALKLCGEFATTDLSEGTRSVILTSEFPGLVDQSQVIHAEATIMVYEKIPT